MTYPNKISLSRKGFDSASGGFPSPILPDGTLLSLPIPSDGDFENTYGTLNWNGKPFLDIIRELKPNSRFSNSSCCHLDPDLRRCLKKRPQGWEPSFGQSEGRVTHLDNQNFGVGDLFLFFGLFRWTELVGGKLRFVKKAPQQHIIFGYLQVEQIIRRECDVPTWLLSHPHAKHEHWQKKNAIYLPCERLSFLPKCPGANFLNYNPNRVLTKDGHSCSQWELPETFKKIHISNSGEKAWHTDFLQLPRGQEYVFESTKETNQWIESIITGK